MGMCTYREKPGKRMLKHLMVALVLSLTFCAVGNAEEDVPILRAMFDVDTYSSETGLLTRTMCAGETVSVSAPIAPDVLRDIAQSALASDLFSIDTSPRPVLAQDGKLRVLVQNPCSYYSFEIAVGGKVNRIDWNCQSLQVGERQEIRRLERVLEPFLEKLPKRICLRY
jgi:hypothetical protein